MFGSKSSKVGLLALDPLREALRSPAPCITVIAPPYRPGEAAGSPSALMKAVIKAVAEHRFPRATEATLLQPLEHLAENPAFASGSHWSRVLFRSPNVFEQFHLRQQAPASVTIAGSFWTRKLLAEFAIPSRFYILALTKTGVALLQCNDLAIEVITLPAGVPDTLSSALALDPPDHDLENRATAGSVTGALRRVRFGTGSGREREPAHLADYYKLVDRGLQKSIHDSNVPLILAGVEEDTALYRTVSTFWNLAVDAIPGSLDIAQDQSAILRPCLQCSSELAVQITANRVTHGHRTVGAIPIRY